jgi:hypothetical protein
MNWEHTMFDGLVSAIIGATLALLGVVLTIHQNNKNNEKRRLSGAGAFTLLGSDGTFFIENKTDEGIIIDVFQKRLFQDVNKVVTDDKKKLDEIYRKINSGESDYFFSKIIGSGNQKFSNQHLANFEKTELPNCEMFGYIAEDIKCVVIGTVISFKPVIGRKKQIEKLYLHRFTMGADVPEPRARWVNIFSRLRDSEAKHE